MAYKVEDYVRPPGLEYALNGAITLDRPLLLTGEPGTGKTELAAWVAHFLSAKYAKEGKKFLDEPLRFNTKTTSQARDLFYTYDALSHFQSANLKGEKTNISDYLELQALGRAIALSNPTVELKGKVSNSLPEEAQGCVVLIDEVDKAPRDFTNDVLDEIDKKRFRLREQNNLEISQGGQVPIVVIMTSNSEKNLPDAFLRRCAFFHIEFPRRDSDLLRTIVSKHLGEPTKATSAAREELIDFFYQTRDVAPRKKPATAELLGWLRLLELEGYGAADPDRQRQLQEYNLSFLVKTQEDLEAVKKII